MREEKAFYNCNECLSEYKFLCSMKNNSSRTCSQRTQFAYLVIRDFLIFLVVLFLAIGTLGFFVFECDYQSQLISSFHMDKQPTVRTNACITIYVFV
jgi:hypothetical protein